MKSQVFFLVCCHSRKLSSRENEDNCRLAKVFSAKFVPEIVIRESFCQKFRVFFASRKFLPAKVSALKVDQAERESLWEG